ncbi:flagellar biosynthesis regulator FlaF [Hyphococcus luteus]|jgi:flagellar protein FlaF|uniref:Flagellar biosynthesis regulator FlhF n=1 Tax=Hyphococcus luteus TaxID=2058213 RepID=A0A2S7K8Q7_9PROT|nr:flagellar biosynthesis regulator FlaF [Marinicaulis flavus]PQA88863.1 flagellar biosynthesis regulator FlhF [Marinicaulis flavus]
MSTSALARNAYHESARSTASPRAVERQLLSKLTTAVVVAQKNREDDPAAFARALGKNLEFWNVVAVDVASESNQLPAELRSQLFYLFEFTQHYTRKLLADEDHSLDAEPLIDINQNIIRGLQGAEDAKPA